MLYAAPFQIAAGKRSPSSLTKADPRGGDRLGGRIGIIFLGARDRGQGFTGRKGFCLLNSETGLLEDYFLITFEI